MPSCLPRSSRPEHLAAPFLVALTLWACGGGQAPPPATGEAPTPKPFSEMKQGERLDYMKKVVMPRMAELFQEANPTRYADMNCATCHGTAGQGGSGPTLAGSSRAANVANVRDAARTAAAA